MSCFLYMLLLSQLSSLSKTSTEQITARATFESMATVISDP